MWGIWGCGGGLGCAVSEPIPSSRRWHGVRSDSEVGNNERRTGFYWHTAVPHHTTIIIMPPFPPATNPTANGETTSTAQQHAIAHTTVFMKQ